MGSSAGATGSLASLGAIGQERPAPGLCFCTLVSGPVHLGTLAALVDGQAAMGSSGPGHAPELGGGEPAINF